MLIKLCLALSVMLSCLALPEARAQLNILEDEPPVLRFSSQSNAQDLAYFCNDSLRGVSETIDIDQELQLLRLAGRVILQTETVTVNADNLTVTDAQTGFIVTSASLPDRPVILAIYAPDEEPKNWDCNQGLAERQLENMLYRGETTILKLTQIDKEQADEKYTIELSGKTTFISLEQDVTLGGNHFLIDIASGGVLDQLTVNDNFRMLQNEASLMAEQALVDFEAKRMIVIDDVVLSLKDNSIVKSERLEIEFNEPRVLSAEKAFLDFILTR